MHIQAHQLEANLKRALVPAYLVFGDEPLQLGEAATAIRDAARAQGFAERELLEVESGFDWSRLEIATTALSLFSTRKLIELRLLSGGIGRAGREALRGYCRQPSADNLLLILAPALERKELKTKWAQELDRIGLLLQVRQIQGPRLVTWIEQRLRGRGMRPGAGVARLLSERIEGNLVAAAQEVEKLLLLYGPGDLDRERLAGAISDSARYDLFDLTDAALNADRERVYRILHGLAAEGTAPALVLWVLARELRMLATLSQAAARGEAQAALRAQGVWESRRGRVLSALQRLPTTLLQDLLAQCALADCQIKGLAIGDPWHALGAIADCLAGASRPDRPGDRPPSRLQI